MDESSSVEACFRLKSLIDLNNEENNALVKEYVDNLIQNKHFH